MSPPRQTKKEIAASEKGKPPKGASPLVKGDAADYATLGSESAQETVRHIVSILRETYDQKNEDIRHKRAYRKWVIPLSLAFWALPLVCTLITIYLSLYTGYPINLASIDPASTTILTILISFSFLALISISIAVLFALRSGASQDEIGMLKSLGRRLLGDQFGEE